MGSATTNAEGVAVVDLTKKEFSGFSPAMIVAKTKDDFNFMPFNTTHVETSRFDVGGNNINSTDLDAFVYSKRDMYRPGETIHLSAIVRNSQWHSPGEIPMKIKILLPNGQDRKNNQENAE